jgi:hypothetical protein
MSLPPFFPLPSSLSVSLSPLSSVSLHLSRPLFLSLYCVLPPSVSLYSISHSLSPTITVTRLHHANMLTLDFGLLTWASLSTLSPRLSRRDVHTQGWKVT